MTIRERLELGVEVAGDQARSWFQGFREDVAAAEGPLGKVKAAGSSMLDGLKANAGPALAAGAAGIAAFAFEAAGKFRDVALDSKALADTMGATIGDASRMRAIFAPLGIEVGDAQDVFNNLSSMIHDGDEALAEFGVTVAKDRQGRVDMNETFIRVVENVGKIEDPAKRAAAAAKFFGEEGARQFLPLISQSDQLRKNLADVSEQQVIDSGELEKAESMRDAQRAISEAVTNITLAVGEIAAGLAPAVENATELLDVVLKIEEATGILKNLANPLPDDGGALGDRIRETAMLGETEQELARILRERGESERVVEQIVQVRRDMDAEAAAKAEELRIKTENMAQANDKARDATADLKDATADLAYQHEVAAANAAEQRRRTIELDEAYQAIFDTIDRQDALLNLGQQFDDVRAKVHDAYVAMDEGAADSEEQIRGAWLATNDLKRSVAEYAQEVLRLPPERVTTMLAQIDQGAAEDVERQLNDIARWREVGMQPSVYEPGGGAQVGPRYAYAAGTLPGQPHPGGMRVVGEHGPEVEYAPPGTMYAPNHDLGRFGGDTYVTIYAPAGYNADDIAESQRRWARRNGGE